MPYVLGKGEQHSTFNGGDLDEAKRRQLKRLAPSAIEPAGYGN
jgi:hypothetical protein